MADAITIPIYTVPKIVHVSWERLTDLPDSLRDNLHQWQNFGWDVHFHSFSDNSTLISTFYSDYQQLYNSLSSDQQGLFCKYAYMHKYGGVVVDINFRPTVDIYTQIQKEIMVTKSATFQGYYTLDFMGGSPGHPFWLDVMKACKAGSDWLQCIPSLQTSFRVGSYVLTGVVSRTKHPITITPTDWASCNLCTTDKCKSSVFENQTTNSDDLWVSVYCYRKQIGIGILVFVAVLVGLLSLNLGGTASSSLRAKRSYFNV